MKLYKYILFDFDGTLIDTNELILQTLNDVSKKFLGAEIPLETMNAILGKYLDDQMKFLSETHYEQMVLYYKELYKARQDKMTKEFAGIGEMLRKLKELGCMTAIVSAKGRGGIEHGLKLFSLDRFIDVVISAYDIRNNKPHPEPALKALEALGGDPAGSLLVGDSPYDIMCGKNAGIKTVLVGWSIFPKDELLKLCPDYIIEEPGELINIVKSSRT